MKQNRASCVPRLRFMKWNMPLLRASRPDAPKENLQRRRGFFLLTGTGAQTVASALDIRTGSTLFGRINNTTMPKGLVRSVSFSYRFVLRR
jgi:hypothetical protein